MLPHFLVKVELHKPRPAAIHRPDTADFASATALRRPWCRCRAGWASVGRRAMTMGVETTDRRHTKVGGRKKGTPKRATADIKARPEGNRRAGEACQARPKRAGARYSMPRPTRPPTAKPRRRYSHKSKSALHQNCDESRNSATVNPGVSRRERMALLTDSGSRWSSECWGTRTGGMTRTTAPTIPIKLRRRSVAP
jgi:hypothetical protein